MTFSMPIHVALLTATILVIMFVYVIKNGFSALTFFYLFFALSAATWGVAAGTISEIDWINNIITRVAYSSTPLLAYSSYLLLTQLTAKNLSGRPVKILGGLTLFTSIFGVTDLVTKDTVLDPTTGDLIIDYGVLYTPVLVLIAVIAISAVVKGVRVYRRKTGEERIRVRLVSISVIFLIIGGYFIGAAVPAIVGNSNYATLTIIPIFLSVSAVSFALSQHKYFDLGLVSTLFASYLFAAGVVFTFVILATLLMFRLTGHNYILPTDVILGFVIISVMAAMLFYLTRKLAKKYLSYTFHQSNYDSEVELRKVSELLVTMDSVDKMINSISMLLIKDLGNDNISIVLDWGDGKKPELHDFKERALKGLSPEDIISKAADLGPVTNTTIMDWQYATKEALFFHRHGIGLIIRMRAEEKTIGYMLVSHRKRRSIYTVNDERFVGLVSDQLAIAVSNAERHEQIIHFNSTLKRRVHQATKNLTETNTKLKALDVNKDEFIGMASHQLRTPLTSIKGYISMILDGDMGDLHPDQRKALEEALDSSQRMVYIISDLLNVSRLRVGKFYTERSRSNLAELVQMESTSMRNLAANKGVEVELDIPKKFPYDAFDENKTRHVIVNFLDNAIYYTPRGGKVKIALKANKKSLVFKVTDTGIGVPKAEQPGLFTKFYRASNARRMRPDGTGLGLFLAEKVISAQGGELIFESEEGKGSTFGFKLPRGKYKPKEIR